MADLVPCGWICPVCEGLFILDYDTAPEKYAGHPPDVICNFPSLGEGPLLIAQYRQSRLKWDNPKFDRWVGLRAGKDIVAAWLVAEEEKAFYPQYTDPQLKDKVFIIKSSLDPVEAQKTFGA